MERIKQQPVYDRADVNQLWSLIILSGSYSKSISFSVFHVKQWKCLNWWQNTRLIEIQVCQVFDKINLTCSLSTSVIDKRVPYTFCAKHPWAMFFLVDRDLIFSFIYLFIYSWIVIRPLCCFTFFRCFVPILHYAIIYQNFDVGFQVCFSSPVVLNSGNSVFEVILV